MQYQIGDFSRISRLSVKTLRFYHECGLLEPNHVDNDSGYRYYDETNLERVKIITELKDLDFSLKEIRDILDHCSDDSELHDYIARKQRDVSEKIVKYQTMQKKLEAFVKQTGYDREHAFPSAKISPTIRHLDEILIASERFIGTYHEISPRFRKLFQHCGKHMSGPPMAIYYDNEYKEDDADIEVCVPVKTPVEADGISSRTLQGANALTLLHTGPYEALGESYKALLDYQYRNNIKVHSLCREIYLKGPGMILPRSPKRFVTEIQMIMESSQMISAPPNEKSRPSGPLP